MTSRLGICLLLSMAATAAEPGCDGKVFGVVGAWQKGGKPLRFGTPVSLGDRICATQAGTLTVGFKDGTASYSCDGHDCKSKPPCSSAVNQRDKKLISGMERFWNAVKPLIGRDDDRLISAVSRGTDLEEAVVAINGDQLDISPMLNDLASGSYWARLLPIEPAGPAIRPVPFQSAPGAVMLLRAPGLRPGLYDVALMDAQGSLLGMSAWVLACGPETYKRNAAAFKDAVALTYNWSGDVDARSTRSVLRAYLQSLWEQGSKR